MKTQEFTLIGVAGLAFLAAFGQQLLFEIFEIAPPQTSVLVVNVIAGGILLLLDCLIVGIQRGRKR